MRGGRAAENPVSGSGLKALGSDGFRIDQCEQNGAHNVTSREAEGTAVGS